MNKFVIMECEGKAPIGQVDLVSEVDDEPWMTGARVAPPKETLIYKTHSKYRGRLKAFYHLGVPIIREDLLKVLLDTGVDNLELFPAVIKDKVENKEYENYKAVNILGLIRGADMSRSELMHGESLTGVDHDFDRLVLDEKRLPSNLLLFRLAESCNAIVVHEKLRNRIEKSGIEGIVFYEEGEWAG